MTTTPRPDPTVTRLAPLRWWRRPWVVPLFFVATVFLAFSIPRYLTLDPADSFVTPPPWFPPYYPLLVTHVLFAAVAMVTCCMQIWPWLRNRHPKWHRVSGRIYVAAAIPAGLGALAIGAVSPFGPVAASSTLLMGTLWLTFTLVGFRMARRRRFVEHRRWMIRSFALTMSIIANRFIGAFATIGLMGYKDTLFHGDDRIVGYLAGGMTTWLGWTLCLLIAEWWLERGTAARRAQRGAVATATGARQPEELAPAAPRPVAARP